MGRLKKIISKATILLVVFGILQAGVFLTPTPAYAQFAVVATNPDIIAKLTIDDAKDEVKRTVFGSIVGAVTTALINIMNSFAQEAAHNAALLVVSGGHADQPLIERRPPADLAIYVGASVASEIINTLVENNVADGRLEGFNVCAPPTLPSLRVGIKSAYQPVELEACGSIQSVKENWGGFLTTVRDNIRDPETRNATVLNTLSSSIDPNVSEFSVTMGLYTETLLASENKGRFDFLEILNKEGVWDVTDFVTGQTTTPSKFIVNEYETKAESAANLPGAIGESLLSNSDALIQVGLNAASIFTNTLLSELTKKLADGLLPPIDLDDDPFDEFATGESSRESAEEALRSLTSFRPLDVTNFNLLGELSSCPSTTRGTARRLYNCVLDTSFATVLGRAEAGVPLTLAEAVEDGLINASRPLIPETDEARDQDPNCYTYGFCHSNLVKMRKARIIPVGWELATQLNEAQNGTLTLLDVMNGFNDCNSENERDDAHPFCHLVDPNWVLKMPDTSCRILAHGQILSAASVSTRAEECVDIQSCISEGDDGTCEGGYGYCVREKNTWQFRGDSCPAHAASCLGFQSRTGESAHYLTTTVDQSGCNEGNAGCTWYSTTQEDPDADGTYDWPQILDTAAEDARPNAFHDRIYLTGEVGECDDDEGGCTELIEREDDLALNVVTNPGFESDANDDGFPDAWYSTDYAGAEYDEAGDEGRTGVDALNPGGIVYQPGITMRANSFYTLSFYAKQPSAATANTVMASLIMASRSGAEVDLGATSYDTDNCTILDTNSNGIEEGMAIVATPDSDSYERFECLFTTPSDPDDEGTIYAFLDISGSSFASTDIWVDDIQLENNTTPTDFVDGYSEDVTNLTKTYLRLPPAYLGCTGSVDDPEACGDYAQMCSENDAGCAEYTPANGDPNVFGITSELDQCDEACVGYDTFKQEPTRYEPSGEFPVYFIADTAEQCDMEAVGCDEFTNLETEELEYFTYLRACVTEEQVGAEEEVFYTWEGSAEEGFQLRTWNLVVSNISSSTTHTYTSGFIESDFGNAPCTHWFADEDGITCDESISDITAADDVDDCDEHDDIFDNPDCREFYDEDGSIHYRDWRDTVTVNDACVSYRKTEIAGLGTDVSGIAGTDDGQENCENSGGYFNTDNNTCIYYGYNEESDVCDADENGCREYTGGQGNNSRVALEDNFEGGLTNWDASSATAVTLSGESIAADGQSITSIGGAPFATFVYDNGAECATVGGCASSTGTLGASCIVDEGEQYCGTLEDELFAGRTYTLTFWAQGNGDLDVGFDFLSNSASPTIDEFFEDDIALTTGWERYDLGPLNMTEDEFPDFGSGTALVFSPDGATEIFVDNIVLREGETNITIIRDSWVTPAQCDENFEGQVSPQFQLGCMEYSDQTGETHYLKSFSRLCEEDVVGCSAFYDTANSDSVNSQVLNATCNTIDGLPVTAKTACYTLQSGGSYVTESPKLCDIAPGEDSCQFDLDHYMQEANIGSDASVAHLEFGIDTTVVPHDTVVYAVYDDEFSCTAAVAGCQEVGLPTFSPDHSVVTEWASTFLINDPDEYEDILCQDDELFCEAWDAGDEGTWHFKHPQNRTCEYKTNVTVAGSSYDGWFRTGTTNFCYGTGTCSNSGSACSLDSECATTVEPDATCDITSGSFIAAGTTSGIWRNGDIEYDGWVGECDSENDGCSEFIDTLDFSEDEFYSQVDGESYYFLDNDNLDENTLLSSERCNGQVSQRLGCVLFYDTGNTSFNYNSSATLVKSRHADQLVGGEEFDLVDPIDCESGDSTITTPSGETVDLCAQRCVYRKSQLYSDFLRTDLTPAQIPEELYELGGSCYTDSDCANYEADTGDLTSGDCTDTLVDPLGVQSDVAVPRLENDTNRVLKVNRDRQCSEWLTCSNQRTVWDESIGAYRTVCEGIDLCRQQGEDGTSTFCTEWDAEDPAVVLDFERYTSRDVTWYGKEYSGYAVPDVFPLQHLSQVNIAPQRACMNSSGQIVGELNCETDADCSSGTCQTPDDDYRLGFDAGECTEDHGESCTVGYCSGNGLPCSTNSQCEPDAGACVTGQCLLEQSTGADSQADCADGEVFVAGACYSEEGFCDGEEGDETLDGTCGVGTCFQSVATQEGACYRNNCVLSMEGDQFDEELEEEQVCRAYPEESSPFTEDLVNLWNSKNGTTESPSSTDGYTPHNTISGFENANFCAPGEDCVCSYQKLQGQSGQPSYISIETDSTDFEGICSGGQADGALCTSDSDCGTDSDGDDLNDDGSACRPLTQVDTIYGLPGFCIERDTGINIQGDPDLGACLTWLPVDELAGSTDLYAKFKDAGFFEDVQLCTDTRMFADKGISRIEYDGSYVACADKVPDGCGNDADEDAAGSAANVDCPDGYFALMGMCPKNGTIADSTSADSCVVPTLTGGRDDRNDYPYVCVPEDSYNDSDGDGERDDRCDPPSVGGEIKTSVTSDDGTTVYVHYKDVDGDGSVQAGTYSAFDDLVRGYEDCWERSEIYDSNFQSGIIDFDSSSNETGNGDHNDYWNLDFPVPDSVRIYPACAEITEVSTTDESYAWTDRLWDDASNDYAITTDSHLAYTLETNPEKYGSVRIDPDDVDGEDPPARIGACFNDPSAFEDWIIEAPQTDAFECEVGYEALDYYSDGGGDPASGDLESRTFIDYQYLVPFSLFTYSHDNDSWSTLGEGTDDIFERITDVFAWPGVGDLWEWSDSDLAYGPAQDASNSYPKNNGTYDVRGAEGSPPTVAGIDPDNCFGSFCEEGPEDVITVNSQNSGDIDAEGGFIRASMNFFAWADENQLPLRRVIIEWGDDSSSGSKSPDNFFKNHRGLQEGSKTASVCDEGGEWGKTEASCDPNFFSYSHNYTCSESEAATTNSTWPDCTFDADGNLEESPCKTEFGGQRACAYQPRVHVRDNWGWCNGTCTLGDEGEDGCFENDIDTLNEASSLSADAECAFESYPDLNSANDPWTYYDGVIYVVP